MTGSESMEQLFNSYIDITNPARSDYFGLIQRLVVEKNRYPIKSFESVEYQKKIDQVYKLVLEEIVNNQGQPVSPIKFGTSGWRGILGKDLFVKSVEQVTTAIVKMYQQLDYIDPENEKLAEALGVAELQEAKERGCVVGFDNRIGGEILAANVVDVLTANGFAVLYAGESTTGTLSATLIRNKAAFSINLTPSHNPLEYGGYKFNAADGGPAASIITDIITVNAAESISDKKQPSTRDQSVSDNKKVKPVDALEQWIEFVRENNNRHGVDYDQVIDDFIDNPDITVAVDSVHGASRLHIRRLFKNSDTNRLILLRGEWDPTFGGIAPEPSTTNMQPVMITLQNRPEPLKLGAIIDPDGDRIRFTDGQTDINMNQFGAMAYHYLHQIKGKKGIVAKTVASSNFANRLADAFGEDVFEPKVGFKEFKPVFHKALVCFEESDGITLIGHTAEKDAYIGLILALDMMLTLKKNLGDYLREIEDEYGYYFPASSGVVVSLKGEELKTRLAALKRFTVGAHITIGNQQKRIKNVIDVDGQKMIMDDDSWIMIRPSGTEPKVRFYVEGRSEEDKTALLDSAAAMLADIGLL